MHEAAAKLLDDAADVVETRGHCKFIREDDEGHVCLLGAFDVVEFGHGLSNIPARWCDTHTAARQLAMSALYEEVGRPHHVNEWINGNTHTSREINLAFWNNDDDRTPDQVIDHLRWTAKRLRAVEEGPA